VLHAKPVPQLLPAPGAQDGNGVPAPQSRGARGTLKARAGRAFAETIATETIMTETNGHRNGLRAGEDESAGGDRLSRGLPGQGEQFGDGLLGAGVSDPADRDDRRDRAAPGIQPVRLQAGGGRQGGAPVADAVAAGAVQGIVHGVEARIPDAGPGVDGDQPMPGSTDSSKTAPAAASAASTAGTLPLGANRRSMAAWSARKAGSGLSLSTALVPPA
jgi:hypothetical protein